MIKLDQIKESKEWDMNISLKELLIFNPTCIVDRNYKTHESNTCYNGYCMYLEHPGEGRDLYVMIGMWEDGFVYIGDGKPYDSLPIKLTLNIVEEMIEYRNNVLKSLNNI